MQRIFCMESKAVYKIKIGFIFQPRQQGRCLFAGNIVPPNMWEREIFGVQFLHTALDPAKNHQIARFDFADAVTNLDNLAGTFVPK